MSLGDVGAVHRSVCLLQRLKAATKAGTVPTSRSGQKGPFPEARTCSTTSQVVITYDITCAKLRPRLLKEVRNGERKRASRSSEELEQVVDQRMTLRSEGNHHFTPLGICWPTPKFWKGWKERERGWEDLARMWRLRIIKVEATLPCSTC
jgi:hypothetical protein